jgi:hypothetical protein
MPDAVFETIWFMGDWFIHTTFLCKDNDQELKPSAEIQHEIVALLDFA